MREVVRILSLGLVVCTTASNAAADTISVGSTLYEDAYVVESDSMYYVLLPKDGSVVNAFKDGGEPIKWIPSNEKAKRDALLLEWKSHRKSRWTTSRAEDIADTFEAFRAQVERRDNERRQRADVQLTTYTTEGVPVLRLTGTRQPKDPAIQALIRDNVARMRGGGAGPGGRRGRTGSTVGVGNAGGSARGGAARGVGGARGGAGGAGAGGGGGGRGGGGGSVFFNISQLFGTIDDASVGETPATVTLMNQRR